MLSIANEVDPLIYVFYVIQTCVFPTLSWTHLILNMMQDLRSLGSKNGTRVASLMSLLSMGFVDISKGLKNRKLWRLIWVWLILIWICWDWLELDLSLLNFDFDLWRCGFLDMGSCLISYGFFPFFLIKIDKLLFFI